MIKDNQLARGIQSKSIRSRSPIGGERLGPHETGRLGGGASLTYRNSEFVLNALRRLNTKSTTTQNRNKKNISHSIFDRPSQNLKFYFSFVSEHDASFWTKKNDNGWFWGEFCMSLTRKSPGVLFRSCEFFFFVLFLVFEIWSILLSTFVAYWLARLFLKK